MSYAPVYLSIFFSDGSIYLTSPVIPCVVTIINPQRACTARVTVVVLYVCVYVCPLIPAASHIGITKERYQRILRNTGIVLNFADFPKKLWRNMPTSSSSGVLALFSQRNKLLCWFEAYSYVFTAQTTSQWKTACDSLAQTRETAQIYGSRILIAPPTSAYTQYK